MRRSIHDMLLHSQYYQLNEKDLSNDVDSLMPLIAGAMSLKEIK
jgi:hypothetical protein